MNIAMLLQMAAEAGFGRWALTSGQNRYAAAELFGAAGGAAERFRDSGCRFVSMLDVSSPATPIALFGAAMAGVPYVPLNYRLPADRIEAQIARLESLYLIADEDGCAVHGSHPCVAKALERTGFSQRSFRLPERASRLAGRPRHRRATVYQRHHGAAQGCRPAP